MGLFEFLMILISVVIGLALSELLSGAAGLLRERDTVQTYWIHTLFQVGAFIALLQQWWESWGLVDVEEIRFGYVLSLLLPSVVLYLIAHLVNPRPIKNADLQEYYYLQAPILWTLVIIGTVVGTFVKPVLIGDSVLEIGNISGFPMIAICVVLALSKNRRVHMLLAPLIIILVLLDTWAVNPAIAS